MNPCSRPGVRITAACVGVAVVPAIGTGKVTPFITDHSKCIMSELENVHQFGLKGNICCDRNKMFLKRVRPNNCISV